MSVNWDSIGHYATDFFTDHAVKVIREYNDPRPLFMFLSHLAPHAANEFDPLQAPEEEIAKYPYIKDPSRRTYAAMVSKLDESVGRLVKELKAKNMLDNSIILFFPDNGAPVVGEFSFIITANFF